MKYSGRPFTPAELQSIRQLIADNPKATRTALSRLVCEELAWRRENGGLKDMSCRVAMLRMQEDGLLQLPLPRNGNNNGKPYLRRTRQAEPAPPILAASPKKLGDLRLQLVTDRRDSHLHNEYIDRYHYLGYQPLPGAQLRYFIRTDEHILALLGFGAAAWMTQPRDLFIGWSPEQREARLHLVVNNARFLILPWVRCNNLASYILAMAARELTGHWQHRYGYRPVLLETFVEQPRFRGTCYQAANWTLLGETTGRGKLGKRNLALLPKKAVWVYPLDTNFRSILCR
ncbi:MAG: DUF4338 domain-containing protein [Chloroflexota bacterium]|nr:DUF4338 domain-containing protein [Chloroflexota bacterium]